MATIIGIAIGAGSLIGLGGLAKAIWVGTSFSIIRIKRKLKKKKLKERLFLNMNSLNYTEFVNIMYEIKNYDDEYHKNLYIKVQKQYFFTEKHFDCFGSFLRRFDSSYKTKQEELVKMIQYEVEKSISQFKGNLDL